MYGIIYCATCKDTGKRYIGKTTEKLSIRKTKHKYGSKYFDSYFYKAINLHGWESFEWEILDKTETKEDLDNKERIWINFHDSRNHEKGYNIKEGGEGGPHSEETKEKIRQTKIGNKNPMFGKVGELSHRSKPIVQLNREGVVLKEWKCAREAFKELGINFKHISLVCLGKRPTAGGFVWKFKE